MGLYDREYYRDKPGGFRGLMSSMVMILITINILIWIIQVVLYRSSFHPADSLGCTPSDVFGKMYIWQIVTANFLHAPERIWHILGNMIFLFFFGRELEAIYGKRDFLIFYLFAGSVAILSEAAISYYLLERDPTIIGASGAVMGTVVLFTLFYPTRKIYLGLMIPIDAWLLCIIFVLLDISGALGGSTGVAHWAHISGGICGLLYRFLDLRWETMQSRFRGLLGSSRSRRRRPRLYTPPPEPDPPVVSESPPERKERDPISERIDEILDKISKRGKESLTEEELDFLKRNSSRYSSE